MITNYKHFTSLHSRDDVTFTNDVWGEGVAACVGTATDVYCQHARTCSANQINSLLISTK